MIFQYKACPDDRWLVVDPWLIYDHDFLNKHFKIEAITSNGSRVQIGSWEEFQQFRKELTMSNYAQATPESGETDAINPSHYKQLLVIKDSNGKITDTIQWLEHLQYKPFWRNNMRAFVQAVMDLCADKYLSRMGMKDDELQEMEKSLWYHKFATAIMKNGYKPVRVKDVDAILNGNPASEEWYVVGSDDKLVRHAQGFYLTFDSREQAAECGYGSSLLLRK